MDFGDVEHKLNLQFLSMTRSSSKCNRVDESCPVGWKVKRAWRKKQFGGGLPAQRFEQLDVVLKGDGIQIGLVVNAQVRAFQTSPAQLPNFVTMTQQRQSLTRQLTRAHGAKRGVEGFVADF